MNGQPALVDTSSPIKLQAQQLCCERDDRVLFSDLDITVTNGELLQLAGPNGSGKTTLLRLLAGLNREYSGELLWHGQALNRVYEEYARQRLYMGHQPAIKKALTPLENLRWLMSPWGQINDQLLYQALEEVQLYGYEETPGQHLSAGQQRRIGLARLCLCTVPLWILDEPFTALDSDGTHWLEKRLQQHVRGGGSVIITSHHALHDIPNLRQLVLGDVA